MICSAVVYFYGWASWVSGVSGAYGSHVTSIVRGGR
jgi:hypothetical protein